MAEFLKFMAPDVHGFSSPPRCMPAEIAREVYTVLGEHLIALYADNRLPWNAVALLRHDNILVTVPFCYSTDEQFQGLPLVPGS